MAAAYPPASMKISVVIPTWNEERWLPRLLTSLKSVPEIGEVIVADNNSTDRTVATALLYGCRVVRGGRPARARNVGASVAKGEIILFADADALVTSSAVRRAIGHLQDEHCVGVHFALRPITDSELCRFLYRAWNSYVKALSLAGVSRGVGSFMIARKWAVEALSGFDEQLDVGEDGDFYRRLRRLGRVVYDGTVSIAVSGRRLKLESPILFSAKCIVWTLLGLLGIRSNILRYRWSRYPAEIADQEAALIP